MNRDIVNINRIGKQPEKDVANDPIADLGEDGTSTGHLKLLEKKTRAPGKAKRQSLDDHHFVQIGDRDRPKPQTLRCREGLTHEVLHVCVFRVARGHLDGY